MSTRDLLNMALRNLLKRKLRTFLTVLGVVIGTASIVVMVSIGIGMNESFARQLEDWGSLQVIDVYSPNGGGGHYMMEEEGSSGPQNKGKQVKLDGAAVDSFRQIAGVEAVSPIKSLYLMIGSGKLVADANFIGLDPATMEAMGYKIEDGRALSGEDVKAIVVGGGVEFYDPKLNWEMRMNSEPPEIELIGEKIDVTFDWGYGTRHADKSVKPFKFEVVGTMPADGNNGWSVIMPLKEVEKIEKAQKEWEKKSHGSSGGNNQKRSKEYEQVMVKVDDIKNVQVVQQQIKDMGYRASSLTDQLEAMKETTKMLRMVLGAIGAISLVVAAIGITNTMVMAIYERTREIGIMKVIGASLRDIKLLFLTEAAFIGFAGGIVGVGVSFVTSKLVNFVAMQHGSDMTSSIPLWLYLGSIAFATVIGVLSGYLPAKRAMKLSALTAIKTE
ncbi:ABC transporter permease [Anaerotignum sp. MB30-C6]|uniref:ABC transporter permease n=1 Tax=Anaerotignum sp. MB30-C6 TaxID=3070814 RepID=UPI0027DC9FC9|nr:ABC transporter permease [Anaerotignum sp. MB30-C6]WMI81704.1 ABC transporter permease [Anaerotignum sp. MB30-C6]